MSLENKPNLYLVRHAESMQNVNQNLDRDSSLSELGKKQAAETGVKLRSLLGVGQLGAIIHTGLTRTIDTAKAIKAAGRFYSPLVKIPEFKEREMGIYDQMDFSELVRRNPSVEPFYQQYRGSCVWFFNGLPGEGVELLEEMKSRISRGLDNLYERYKDTPLIVVGHAGSVKMIRMLYEMPDDTNLPEYLSSYVPGNCDIYKLL